MRNLKRCFIPLLTVVMIVLITDQGRADNTYRYYYLYRNSDVYKSYHQDENDSSGSEEEDNSDFSLYEDERDYYLEGDQEYRDEMYEEENEESIPDNSNIYRE